MITALPFVPALSDNYGRKNIFCATMFVSVLAQIGLLKSDSLYWSTVFMFIMGLSWPGKRVTGLNYALEFVP